jgi:cell fate regulator YaaT (PSP1 superfamily)
MADIRPFVSVKFTPVGRSRTFLLPELAMPPHQEDNPKGSLHEHDPKGSYHTPSDYKPGDQVVVETADGRAIGTVTRTIPAMAARRQPPPNSPDVVVRRATREDILLRLRQRQREDEAHRICLLKIQERGLAMKLTRVEQTLDGMRLVFYYTSEGRVDFRELVRDLAAHFRTRIEMRQIGVRDEAKMIGGYGPCGRPLCCTTWLPSFEPITIKMAKQQNLSLNPSKLSGMCGRLKCCLRYELPNGKGVKHGGCAEEGSCNNPTGCGTCATGGCGSGGCGSCH